MRTETYRTGDLILTEGEPGSDAFIVESGIVEVFRAGPPELRLILLGPGQSFGEMALITEQPRSASVRALDDVELRVIPRDEFLAHLKSEPERVVPLLRALSERVRNLTMLVEELSRRLPSTREAVRAHLSSDAPLSGSPRNALDELRVRLDGLTPRAIEALDGRAVTVDRFPYRIGRLTSSDDPFSANELAIRDTEPLQVSRNHCMITRLETRCFLIDRGSRLGTILDGKVVGGSRRSGRKELTDGPHELRLGGRETPFRFALTVGRGDPVERADRIAAPKGD